MGEIFERVAPSSALEWTGERLTTETKGQVEIEHLHRYFFARTFCRGLDVLDIAAGEGYGSALLAQVAKSVTGVEIAPETVEHARAAYQSPGLSFLQGDARQIPCPDDSFDVVVSFETLEHFYEHAEFMAEVRRVLRPDGLFIISSPERDVYSPAGGTPNPYHVHELTHAEFNSLLQTSFKHVSMYAQRALLGSALIAETLPANPAPLVTFERRDARLFEASTGLPRPLYLFAIASDQAFTPSVGSLYVETSGVESIFARSAEAQQQIQELTQRLVNEGEYAQRVQAELNRRDEQLAGQVREKDDFHRQLIQRNEEHAHLGQEFGAQSERVLKMDAALSQYEGTVAELRQRLLQSEAEYEALTNAHGRLLEQRAARHARIEAALRTELQQRDEQIAELSRMSALREQGEFSRISALRDQSENDIAALLTQAEHAKAELQAVLTSASWQITGPLRGLTARHPSSVARFKGFVARHPRIRRMMVRAVRGTWRVVTLRSPWQRPPEAKPVSSGNASSAEVSPPIELAPTDLASIQLAPTDLAPDGKARLLFRQQAIAPAASAQVVSLSRDGRRRALCVGHVLPFPPRAGNEYRIHRLLSWLAQQGWDLLVVVCPLPHEMPSAEQMAAAAAVYPNLIICTHDGLLYHHLASGSEFLDKLSPGQQVDIPTLLNEVSDGNSAAARILGLSRAFCPDALVELLLQLQDIYEPNLFLAEYIFMTRPFALLRPEIVTAVDTIDVFSSKAKKVEHYGVTDGLAMSEAEEASLLQRADILIGIQAEEAGELARLAPDCTVVSVGVDFPVAEPDRSVEAGATVLLVASGNPMNVKGLQDFLKYSWPSVLRDVPDAELLIVGAIGESLEEVPDRVSILGRVDDLRPLYAQARVVINPAVAGTGLKIKTIEALCHLRPVVCWPSGVDGVGDEARSFCYVAADWDGFSDHVTKLLRSDDEAFAAERAYEALRHAFSPETVYSQLQEALDAV